MTTTYPKRLIEVDLPIKRISMHSRRDKLLRHGHISTLHIWWARRPLAACRAVICAALWPDPVNITEEDVAKARKEGKALEANVCPPAFVAAAKKAMSAWAREHLSLCSKESFPRFVEVSKNPSLLDDGRRLRTALLDFIADFSNWDNATIPAYLQVSRSLTSVSHEALGGTPGTRPLVADPFSGGGAIPLEALRIGADAFASDLNPIPVVLNKVVLEYIPKYGQKLSDEVQKWGAWIQREAEQSLSPFYPRGSDAGSPIAYLWARTINCEGPGCGVEVPLIRNMQITRSGRKWHFAWGPLSKRHLDIRVCEGGEATIQPTVAGGSVTCPRPECGYTTSPKAVRAQLHARRGGARDARLLAVLRETEAGRIFVAPTASDLRGAQAASESFTDETLAADSINGVRPYKNTRGLSAVTRIGIQSYRDIYTPRQALAIQTFQGILTNAASQISDPQLRLAVATLLHCAVSRFMFQNCSLSRWNASRSTLEGAFGKQALQVVWDFAESNPIGEGPANWSGAVEWVRKVIEANLCIENKGTVARAKAQDQVLPDDSVQALITDPPYFAAIPYSDLSNVFFVWEREFFREFYPELYAPGLVPQEDEIIVTNANLGANGSSKSPQFYRDEMRKALEAGRRIVSPHGICVVVFADSSAESWEAILGAVIDAGWVVTGSWPLDTELQGRTQAEGSASLQSSIHIVCRPREDADGTLRTSAIGDWRDVLQDLPRRIHEWMPRLAEEGVVGADAIFACLGPALEIFSRHSRVEKASGEAVTLNEYLEHVWAAVSKEALSSIFAGVNTEGFEPDARLTAMWLWTLSAPQANGDDGAHEDESDGEDDPRAPAKKTAKGGFVLEYDTARKIAQGLGAHLEKLDSLIEISGDKARLLPVSERTQYLFGNDQVPAPVGKKKSQMDLFTELSKSDDAESAWSETIVASAGETTLDRVHQSMILFAANRGEALRRFLVGDGVGKDQRFWRLAQALSALYPNSASEKRWVDGVLARKKGLGL